MARDRAGGNCIFHCLSSRTLYPPHVFPKCPPALDVHKVPSCTQHLPSPVLPSSYWFPIWNNSCPLTFRARLLAVVSSSPPPSPPSHSLPHHLLWVPRVPAPDQASSSPASQPPVVSPPQLIPHGPQRGLSDTQL